MPTKHETETCEVCGKVAVSQEIHPCRFEKACPCWYGTPCVRRVVVLCTRCGKPNDHTLGAVCGKCRAGGVSA